MKPVVTYVDVPWAVGPDGTVDPALATIERSVLRDDAELRFMPLDPLEGSAALVINRCVVTPELLDTVGPSLTVIARQGVGYDNLSSALLESRGVIGFNVPDYCVGEVATHTLALALALERRILPQHLGLTGGTFDVYAGGIPRRTHTRVAGIIGLGRIGRAVAARLRAFYERVVAFDPYVSEDVMAAEAVTKLSFDELLGTADLISIHCLLHDETYHLLDARAFSLMRPGTYVVNTARGAIVDGRAMYEALRDGVIAGAGLDVFDPENPHDDKWWRQVVTHPSVVVTSHRAFLSRESVVAQRRRVAEGLRHVLMTGRPPAVGHVTAATHPALTIRTE